MKKSFFTESRGRDTSIEMTPDLNPGAYHIKPASVIKHDNLIITLNIQDCV